MRVLSLVLRPSSRSGRLLRTAVVAPLVVAPLVVAPLAVSGAAHHRVTRRSPPAPRPLPDKRSRYSISVQSVFDPAGNPSLVANFSPDGSLAVPKWSICRSGQVRMCSGPITTSHAILTPGPEPAGTVFRASATYRGHTYVATVTWRGRVQVVSPPTLQGRARVGSPVVPVAGSWRGGWGTEFDQLGVEACRTSRGGTCVMLSGGQPGCPGGSGRAAVGGWFTGWYLFALDIRSAHDEACAGVGFALASDVPPWPVSHTIARSSPIGPAVGPPAPTVRVLRHALYRGSRVLVARVRCSSPCKVTISVEGQTYEQAGRATVTGTKLVGVPRAHLVPGPVLVFVNVDAGPTITGRTALP